jgi:AcrR family transcriptional regulator
MSRAIDFDHRASLLDRVMGYVVEHGLSDLSLRPLANALGVTPTTLVHHFGTKDRLVELVLNRVRERLIAIVEHAVDGPAEPSALMLAAWRWSSAPEHEQFFRLFFEVYGAALARPDRYAEFLDGVVEDWFEALERRLIDTGDDPQRARLRATLGLAVIRGLLLDLLTTGDRERVTDAVEAFAAQPRQTRRGR